MLDLLITSLCFIFPAYVANMVATTTSYKFALPFKKPINEKLFGNHKTYSAFYMAYFGALLTLFIQQYLYEVELLDIYSFINYSEINIFFYAFLFGVGALTGDLIKSFFKRLLNKKPGSPWPPFDQIDVVLGATLFLLPFQPIPLKVFLTLLIITPILHLLVNFLAYKLKLKDVWW